MPTPRFVLVLSLMFSTLIPAAAFGRAGDDPGPAFPDMEAAAKSATVFRGLMDKVAMDALSLLPVIKRGHRTLGTMKTSEILCRHNIWSEYSKTIIAAENILTFYSDYGTTGLAKEKIETNLNVVSDSLAVFQAFCQRTRAPGLGYTPDFHDAVLAIVNTWLFSKGAVFLGEDLLGAQFADARELRARPGFEDRAGAKEIKPAKEVKPAAVSEKNKIERPDAGRGIYMRGLW